MNTVNSEQPAAYSAGGEDIESSMRTMWEDDILSEARRIARDRINELGDALTSPALTREFLANCFVGLEHEVFSIILLTNRNKVIKYVEMFRGTIDGASVYPREVVKLVMQHNAAAVILAHNHPSGTAEPSQADIRITERLSKALGLIDVRVLDHVVIGSHDAITNFSERGLI